MNPATILQSNLLDIVFENRNKDYGAYRLRKYYNKRMSIALLIMFGMILLFSIFNFLWKGANTELTKTFVFQSKDNDLHSYQNKPQAISVAAKQRQGKIQKQAAGETTPQIVDDKKINNLMASINHGDASELVISGNNFEGGDEAGLGLAPKGDDGPLKVAEKIEKKPEILPFAEVMPQYPGGINALITFLKKNLHAPDDIEEGKEISVKVQFVVNFNGQLQGFKVVETGGEVFDNEVLRVLRKMPLWIPGKSHGENVAVYYTVPVKFRSDSE